MTCSQVRRELLEHFAFREELGPSSGPHLAHLESCADCRREVGMDRALVRQLRRALRERVEGSSPSVASWELVRRRTVDRPVRPWTVRVLQWRGVVSAAAAGIMVFAVATAPQTRVLPGAQSPVFVAPSARRGVPPVDEGSVWSLALANTYWAPRADAPLPGWPMATQMADEVATNFSEPPTGRMR
jgi:anti-sigma factor RsiW